MKIFIIVLFFILILFLSITVSIDIEKLEVYNKAITFRMKLKIYIFKYIKVFQKKIHKKDITKLVEGISKKNIIQDERIIKNVKYTFSDMHVTIEYGIRNVLINTYTYGIINMIIPMLITTKDIKYNITTNFQTNFISIQAKGKIRVGVLENAINFFKQNIVTKAIKKLGFVKSSFWNIISVK